MDVTGYRIEQSGVLDLSKQTLKSSEDIAKLKGFSSHEAYLESLEQPKTRTFNNPIDPGHPLNAPYAEVVIPGNGGKDVTIKISNNGFMETPNGFLGKLGVTFEQLEAWSGNSNGPETARIRAEKIAELTGGTVQLAETAITNPNQYPNSFTYSQEQLTGLKIDNLVTNLRRSALQE